MAPADRADLAATKIDRVIDLTTTLIQTHGNNQVINFSPLLSEQIPQSYGAHAFNDFQRGMFVHELTRLVALWDKPDLEKNSIPTVIALLNDPATLRYLLRAQLKRCYRDRGNTRILNKDELEPEYVVVSHKIIFKRNLRDTKQLFRRRTRTVFGLGNAVIDSQRLANLSGYRDRHIAHNIDRELDKMISRGKMYEPPQYAQAHRLLHTSCKIINAINGITRSAYFSFDSRFEIARKNADRLWQACKFEGVT